MERLMAAPAGTGAPNRRAVVELRGVSKWFGGTHALDGVDLDLLPGEVHALVGENGAGKSTLGKIIAGVYQRDGGALAVDGAEVGRWDPVRAGRHGIAMIAQELALVPELTVAQNVFLGRERSLAGVLRRGHGNDAAFDAVCALAGFRLPPRRRVAELGIADQQKVEIMRSLARDARVIVMDEPTSSLTAHETEQLHRLIAALRDQGRTVVYVSHFLDAVLDVADRVSVMRDGALVRTANAADETKPSLIEGMLGRPLAVTFPERPPPVDPSVPPILEVAHLATADGVVDVSLSVRPGEIVGLLGLVGSGRSEIARAIYGADRITGGTVTFDGTPHARPRPHRSIAAGLAMVPEDRHGQGLVLERPIRENIALAHATLFATAGVISRRRERAAVNALAERLALRPARTELTTSGFSGGNQQKALIGKALLGDPAFVILDEPTRGVDVGAKYAIHELVVALARQGVGILLISSEHEEVMGLAHRAHLVRDGRTFAEVVPERTTVDRILTALFGADQHEGAAP
ncbi:sugar ABC transporter ATP-binding protein [Streptomyces radicis]|uniref:Sugar ABC transporter ATP-binding protein n=1 Tax=Streptomyces radicis TaxID=1750517 RepID=A0A3A9WF37_9ACTN|nr:sugar ABC transporter ATP-binding protein [Streptomyces radicis]RKN06276.1 sugar ABC transporter ATP-binding protein [Streptomyces radicis]RKN18606.1 sugar ABC transporter ATP-binding protein [Streptomyces radicis]